MKGWLAIAFSIVVAGQLMGGQGPAKSKKVLVTGSSAPTPFLATVTLNVSPSAVNFAASNPIGGPVAGDSPLTTSFTLTNTTNNATWTLTMQALGAKLVGTTGDTIPVGAISYTATGSMLAGGGKASLNIDNASGVLSTTAVQTASGKEGNKTFQGQVTYTLAFTDNWSYVPTTYTQTVALTLTAP